MELAVSRRTIGKKGEVGHMRREGCIPAVLYSRGKKGDEISVESIAFRKLLDALEPGTLCSQRLTLLLDGTPIRAIVKEIQYAVTTYRVIHLDFMELHDDVPVTLNIPLMFTNATECAGVKLGGVLRQVTRQVRVRCLPKDIPDHFTLDVRHLTLGQSLKLSALDIPEGVRPVTDLKQVAVVVAKK